MQTNSPSSSLQATFTKPYDDSDQEEEQPKGFRYKKQTERKASKNNNKQKDVNVVVSTRPYHIQDFEKITFCGEGSFAATLIMRHCMDEHPRHVAKFDQKDETQEMFDSKDEHETVPEEEDEFLFTFEPSTSQLRNEWNMYQHFHKRPTFCCPFEPKPLAPIGVCQAYLFEKLDKGHVLFMDRCGPTLDKFAQFAFPQMPFHVFPVHHILDIALDLLRTLRFIHSKGIVHCDVKPDNIMLPFYIDEEEMSHSIREKPPHLCIADFGLSKFYIVPVRKKKARVLETKHIPLHKLNRGADGSLRYMSPNTHMGYPATRRDDLISLGYMLVSLFRGRLPWSSKHPEMLKQLQADKELLSDLTIQAQRFVMHKRVASKKCFTSLSELCRLSSEPDASIAQSIRQHTAYTLNQTNVSLCCSVFEDTMILYFEEVFSYSFEATPNYTYLHALIQKAQELVDQKVPHPDPLWKCILQDIDASTETPIADLILASLKQETKKTKTLQPLRPPPPST